MRCIVIGAGVSGLLMVQRIKEVFGNSIEVKAFEKNNAVGGTWLENRYPGCACDVPSHIYQYSFAPNPYWSRLFASSQEIQHYLHAFAQHYDLLQHIQFSTTVTRCEWHEDRAVWSVEINTGDRYECEVLFNAGGILNNPNYPDLKHLDIFQGQILHTAAWNDNVDLHGKRIAIVGAGASAIQLLPALQPQASHIDIYIRTPSWITKPLGVEAGDATNKEYSEEEMRRFVNDSDYSLQQRKTMEAVFNSMFSTFLKQSNSQRETRCRLESRMRDIVVDKDLQQHLIPDFEVGCRRLNPGEPYLEAIQRSNVQPVFDPIQEITSSGIRSKDVIRCVDAIVLATGFNTSFRPRFPIIGANKLNLQDLWEDDPMGYFGVAVSGYPNYLTFLGPNTPISNGSLIGTLEATADYFLSIIHKMIDQDVTTFDVLPDAQADFNQHTQQVMKKMVWTGTCRSWYKNNTTGRVTAVWPGSSLHYREVLASRRFEDFQWTYKSNRFSHWKDGFSGIELHDDKGDQDLSYYIHSHPNLPKELLQMAARRTSILDSSDSSRSVKTVTRAQPEEPTSKWSPFSNAMKDPVNGEASTDVVTTVATENGQSSKNRLPKLRRSIRRWFSHLHTC